MNSTYVCAFVASEQGGKAKVVYNLQSLGIYAQLTLSDPSIYFLGGLLVIRERERVRLCQTGFSDNILQLSIYIRIYK